MRKARTADGLAPVVSTSSHRARGRGRAERAGAAKRASRACSETATTPMWRPLIANRCMAPVEEKPPLLGGGEILLLAEHHCAIDRRQGGLALEAPAEQLVHPGGRSRAEPAVGRGGSRTRTRRPARKRKWSPAAARPWSRLPGGARADTDSRRPTAESDLRALGGSGAARRDEREVNPLSGERPQGRFGGDDVGHAGRRFGLGGAGWLTRTMRRQSRASRGGQPAPSGGGCRWSAWLAAPAAAIATRRAGAQLRRPRHAAGTAQAAAAAASASSAASGTEHPPPSTARPAI